MTSPLVGLLAAIALVSWWRARRRRRRVPGGPIIHRDVLEAAEREVRGMPSSPQPDRDDLDWGPDRPRSPIHL